MLDLLEQAPGMVFGHSRGTISRVLKFTAGSRVHAVHSRASEPPAGELHLPRLGREEQRPRVHVARPSQAELRRDGHVGPCRLALAPTWASSSTSTTVSRTWRGCGVAVASPDLGPRDCLPHGEPLDLVHGPAHDGQSPWSWCVVACAQACRKS